jgi:hypothetical protein
MPLPTAYVLLNCIARGPEMWQCERKQARPCISFENDGWQSEYI